MLSVPTPLPPMGRDAFPTPPPAPVSQQPPPPIYSNNPPIYAQPVQTPPPQPIVQAPVGQQQASGEATRLITVSATPRGAVVAVLIGIGGRLSGDVYKVHDGENRMGRLKSADIALDARDDTISREHALIIHQDGAFGLRPLRPDNPTWVNGEQVEEGAPLADGDQIRVGQSTFRFRTA